MTNLVHQRCFHHAGREAVARCPQCTRFYCRECITEHDDRVICAACLKLLVASHPLKTSRFSGLRHGGGIVAGILVAWFFFFVVGELLLTPTTSTHGESLWQSPRSRSR